MLVRVRPVFSPAAPALFPLSRRAGLPFLSARYAPVLDIPSVRRGLCFRLPRPPSFRCRGGRACHFYPRGTRLSSTFRLCVGACVFACRARPLSAVAAGGLAIFIRAVRACPRHSVCASGPVFSPAAPALFPLSRRAGLPFLSARYAPVLDIPSVRRGLCFRLPRPPSFRCRGGRACHFYPRGTRG